MQDEPRIRPSAAGARGSARALALCLVAGLVAAGVAAWGLRSRNPTAAAAPVDPFRDVAGSLSSVPGQEQRVYPTELDYKLDSIDPAVDGWDTEVWSDAINEQLHGIEEVLAHPQEISEAAVAPYVAASFAAGPVLPAALESVFASDLVTVRRMPEGAAAASAQFRGPGGLARALAALMQAYEGPARIKLKLSHIDKLPDAVATTIDFQSTGKSGSGVLQQNAIWTMVWSPPATGQPPRAQGLTVEFHEEVVGPPDGTTLLEDWTSSVLGADPTFEPQLMRGQTHWASAIDVTLGEQMLGHHGLAVGDVNGDGLDDIHLAQPGGVPDRLYVQQPDGTARDVAAQAGVDYLEPTSSALILDFDNDGDQDLLTSSGPLVFHSNDGEGRFKVEAMLPTSPVYSMAAADYDLDGDLDVYATKYGSPDKSPPTPYYDANNGTPNLMLRNDGHWSFTDITRESGLDENNRKYSFAAGWADYDNDGDPDLFVANDFGRDNLYRNDGGKFSDVAGAAGVDDISAGMGVAWGDYNQDGWLDLYVSNMWSSAGNRTTFQPRFEQAHDDATLASYQRHARGNTLYENAGDGTFRDVSIERGVTMARWAWGSKFIDLDNNGLEDLFVANGYVTNDDPKDL